MQLRANQEQSLTCYTEHTLIIQVRKEDDSPIAASILIDGTKVSQASDKELQRGPGQYTITVEKFGYDVLPATQQVTFEPMFGEPPAKTFVVFHIREQ